MHKSGNSQLTGSEIGPKVEITTGFTDSYGAKRKPGDTAHIYMGNTYGILGPHQDPLIFEPVPQNLMPFCGTDRRLFRFVDGDISNIVYNGTHAHFFDNRAHGDDNLLTRVLSPYSVMDVVMDGATQSLGETASRITAEKLRTDVIQSYKDIGRLLRDTNDELFSRFGSGIGALTTVAATLKDGDQLYPVNAGDSSAYLFRDSDIIKLTTPDKIAALPASCTHFVGEGKNFSYHTNQAQLQRGDKLMLATDGITDNIDPDELYQEILRGIDDPDAAVEALKRLIERKESDNIGREDFFGGFKPDDMTAIFRFF